MKVIPIKHIKANFQIFKIEEKKKGMTPNMPISNPLALWPKDQKNCQYAPAGLLDQDPFVSPVLARK